jgi:hypothetical protein
MQVHIAGFSTNENYGNTGNKIPPQLIGSNKALRFKVRQAEPDLLPIPR